LHGFAGEFAGVNDGLRECGYFAGVYSAIGQLGGAVGGLGGGEDGLGIRELIEPALVDVAALGVVFGAGVGVGVGVGSAIISL
jgi:hypothetical protein